MTTKLLILPDTNILFSAIIWEKSNPAKALEYAITNYTIALCPEIIYEINAIISKKAPSYTSKIRNFFSALNYKAIPSVASGNVFIRDKKDQPILNAAIASKVDIILTGDRDFLVLNIAKPKILSASAFLDRFCKQEN